jgi:hypothetical protein
MTCESAMKRTAFAWNMPSQYCWIWVRPSVARTTRYAASPETTAQMTSQPTAGAALATRARPRSGSSR